MKVLIVGGVAGGASAAARLRRISEEAEIIMFEKGEHISFANCGLPYYIGGAIEQRDALLVQTPEKMKERFNIDVRVNSAVQSIDREAKKVRVKNTVTGAEYDETYDKLILSPGAMPLKPPIPGIESKSIYILRNIPDTDKIKKAVDEEQPKTAVVVGGGFIGLEMAENLHERGIGVTIVEMADQVMTPVDYEMASIVHGHLMDKGITLLLKDGVKAFEEDGERTFVVLQSGRRVPADIIVLAIGVKPDVRLAKEAGLDIGERGGILVNSYLQTSDPDIYAVGDAIEVSDFISGASTLIPLAGPANKQGRIAANNICGRTEEYKGTQGTSIVKVFDLTVASTGSNEKMLKRAGVQYRKTYTESNSHAGYYPGAFPMNVKLLYTPEGKILGAQIVGYEGVDKRIDVIATAVRFGKSVHDLEELELAYAPPYSSAKDPVNMAGYAAANFLKGDTDVIFWDEIDGLDRNNTVILDIRDKEERDMGYIEGSVHIPLSRLRERLHELPKDKGIVVYCQIGLRAYIACRILVQKGFRDVKNLSGGFKLYNAVKQSERKLNDQGYDEKGSVRNGAGGNSGMQKADEARRVRLNACGLSCPGPIMQVYKSIQELEDGEVLEVLATDPGFVNDIKQWCDSTGNTLLECGKDEKSFYAHIRKGCTESDRVSGACAVPENADSKTIVVFSGDLDKAIASFVIANGAASMGRKVTMFFTFWGLNILRKDRYVNAQKGFMDRMFGMMMPRGSRKLGLSRMNMAGIGPKLIRKVMKDKGISSLEQLIVQARQSGVKLMACNMSMDVMGIKIEELIDGIEVGGVAAYLGEAEKSNVNLFI
ncbi:MAG: CoA-disulfide reductase / Disulfide bond regulator [Firmicutes bacterium]|nr:CoA-disulfide reductase / Disulfide bond regulator [Bacillota bacterium]MDI6705244.1 FAD-dependent oxidoreductase [Bacillota bacterium]